MSGYPTNQDLRPTDRGVEDPIIERNNEQNWIPIVKLSGCRVPSLGGFFP